MKPRKRFGQNFLVDRGLISKIAAAINPLKTDRIVEIGPGRGAITRALVNSGCDLTLIEIDRDLSATLAVDFPTAHLITRDVMKIDFTDLASSGAPIRIVGNLPYNISTPLLFKLFQHASVIKDMYFMLQLEVVDRMTAVPSTKSYGRLSIMTQLHCDPQKMFEVPPEAFSPRPKVQSAIIRLMPKEQRLDVDSKLLESILIQAFSARRKTIRNAMKKFLTGDEIISLDLNPSLRPENLTLHDFVNCARLAAAKL